MTAIMRRYKEEKDFWRIRRFLRDLLILNDLREKNWTVARLDYWRWHGIENCNSCGPLEQVTFLWETPEGELAAVLNPEDRGSAFIQIHPSFKNEALEEEMIALAEQELSLRRGGRRRLAIWTDSQDHLRLGLLQAHGFHRGRETENQWRRDLDSPVPDPVVAPGYTVRALGDASELPARSWASWRGFHPDQPDEDYEGWQWYLNIQRCPLYRRDLDIIAMSPDGVIAAITTFWYDDDTRTAYIEPVATVPEHQRRGLARAVITEGLQRVQRLGAIRAFVGGLAPGPNDLYSSVLSPECDLLEEWVKEW